LEQSIQIRPVSFFPPGAASGLTESVYQNKPIVTFDSSATFLPPFEGGRNECECSPNILVFSAVVDRTLPVSKQTARPACDNCLNFTDDRERDFFRIFSPNVDSYWTVNSPRLLLTDRNAFFSQFFHQLLSSLFRTQNSQIARGNREELLQIVAIVGIVMTHD